MLAQIVRYMYDFYTIVGLYLCIGHMHCYSCSFKESYLSLKLSCIHLVFFLTTVLKTSQIIMINERVLFSNQ